MFLPLAAKKPYIYIYTYIYMYTNNNDTTTTTATSTTPSAFALPTSALTVRKAEVYLSPCRKPSLYLGGTTCLTLLV